MKWSEVTAEQSKAGQRDCKVKYSIAWSEGTVQQSEGRCIAEQRDGKVVKGSVLQSNVTAKYCRVE